MLGSVEELFECFFEFFALLDGLFGVFGRLKDGFDSSSAARFAIPTAWRIVKDGFDSSFILLKGECGRFHCSKISMTSRMGSTALDLVVVPAFVAVCKSFILNWTLLGKDF